MTEFTPGPWYCIQTLLGGKNVNWMSIISEPVPDGALVAYLAPSNHKKPPYASGKNWAKETDANAHLIAAVPDLLAALEELADLVDAAYEGETTLDSFTTQIARAAIAKARNQ